MQTVKEESMVVVNWVTDRMKEPSSYAAAGAIVMLELFLASLF